MKNKKKSNKNYDFNSLYILKYATDKNEIESESDPNIKYAIVILNLFLILKVNVMSNVKICLLINT